MGKVTTVKVEDLGRMRSYLAYLILRESEEIGLLKEQRKQLYPREEALALRASRRFKSEPAPREDVLESQAIAAEEKEVQSSLSIAVTMQTRYEYLLSCFDDGRFDPVINQFRHDVDTKPGLLVEVEGDSFKLLDCLVAMRNSQQAVSG